MAIIQELEAEGKDFAMVKMSELPFHGNEKFSTDTSVAERQQQDPKVIARRYQLQLCQKAKEENIIVYLETGCGKTLIAVLLIQEFAEAIKKPGRNVCVFLAPTVPLVEQQADVIRLHSNFKVGRYYGEAKHSSKAHQDWIEELEKYEVLVMTPDILLHNLHHCFMKMELIELLIFDECHHAQKRHPYAQIMREFFKKGRGKCPRIFGMTASPIMGKGGSNQVEYAKGINSLEQLLDAKVYTVVDRSELESFVPSPITNVWYYNKKNSLEYESIVSCQKKFDECKQKHICLVFSCCNGKNMEICKHDVKGNMKKTKTITRLYGELMYCLDELGLWGAKQAVTMQLDDMVGSTNANDDNAENHVANAFLRDSSLILDPYVEDAFEEPFFSSKVKALVEILSQYRNRKDMKCIVFVKRIITARLLTKMINYVQLKPVWRCEFLVGCHSGMKEMSRAKMNKIVEKFRSGEFNLLVATNVAEEGLDIQTCCLVVRFDLPNTVASFIQSRGRARMQESGYIFLVERGNLSQEKRVEHFIDGEEQMRREVQNRSPDGAEQYEEEEDQIYRVNATDATISTGCCVSLLHHFCSKLSKDEYFIPVPEYSYFEEPGGVVCRINLPSNAPIRQIDGPICSSMEKAKRVACLEACKVLHSFGALTDYLLPREDEQDEEYQDCLSADACKPGEGKRSMELYEMRVPVALQGGWNKCTKSVYLHAYIVDFNPVPPDREYTQFALFLESSLPNEAERMNVELHLAHGRIVKTELLPSRSLEFDPSQLRDALNFQEIFLRILLDRQDFRTDYVELGTEDVNLGLSSTSYLLLPVQSCDSKQELCIDWKIIKDCLSSPVFSHESKGLSAADDSGNQLEERDFWRFDNGWVHIDNIRNTLVVTSHNDTFYCIVDILHEINANSYAETMNCSYADYYKKKYNVTLEYREQPFLKAKQLLGLHNLLHDRSQVSPRSQANHGDGAKEEKFVELPAELCYIKLTGFSSPLASAVSLLPSMMHRLENLLVAIELKELLTASFPEGSQITASRVLEAITTERCMEGFSLERLEVLGDAFLKYAVSRRLFLVFDKLDEGQLTKKRSNSIKNSNLYKRAKGKGFPAFIRDEYFDLKQYFALGRPCKNVCTPDVEKTIHYFEGDNAMAEMDSLSVKCTKRHHLLHMKTIADVVEALIGAYLVDSGFPAALAFLKWMGIEIDFDASLVGEACLQSRNNLSLIKCIDIDELERLLGYNFIHKGLLLEAFAHPSFNEHNGGCYQRLEFLGDAVLDYIITSYLYSVYPDMKPGYLTDMRSMTVNNESFASVAVRHGLYMYLIQKSDSLSSAVRKYVDFTKSLLTTDRDSYDEPEPKCPKVLGDIVESFAGALVVDTGFDLECVWKLVLRILEPIVTPETLCIQPVRELSEVCQHHNLTLDYRKVPKGNGFLVEANVSGKKVSGFVGGSGTRTSIKDAKKVASKDALLKLKGFGLEHPHKILEVFIRTCRKGSAVLVGKNKAEQATSNIIITERLEEHKFFPSRASCSRDLHGVRSTSEFIPPGTASPQKNASTICEQPQLLSTSLTENDVSSTNQNKEADQEYTNSDHHYDIANTTEYQWPSASWDTDIDQFLGSAKSSLNEFCQKRSWGVPEWVCYKEEGMPHQKSFTYMAVLKLPENICIECLGEPKKNKRLAMESASRGALWWLNSQGYL